MISTSIFIFDISNNIELIAVNELSRQAQFAGEGVVACSLARDAVSTYFPYKPQKYGENHGPAQATALASLFHFTRSSADLELRQTPALAF